MGLSSAERERIKQEERQRHRERKRILEQEADRERKAIQAAANRQKKAYLHRMLIAEQGHLGAFLIVVLKWIGIGTVISCFCFFGGLSNGSPFGEAISDAWGCELLFFVVGLLRGFYIWHLSNIMD